LLFSVAGWQPFRAQYPNGFNQHSTIA